MATLGRTRLARVAHLAYRHLPARNAGTTVLSLGIAILIGVSLGIKAAQAPGGIADKCLTTFTLWGFSVPNFVFGILLILVFAVALNWLPPRSSCRSRKARRRTSSTSSCR